MVKRVGSGALSYGWVKNLGDGLVPLCPSPSVVVFGHEWSGFVALEDWGGILDYEGNVWNFACRVLPS